MTNIALLTVRIVSGLLVAGHGAQKLFGWFDGPGLQNWTAVTEQKLGMRPAKFWAPVGAFGEFGGGLLTETIHPTLTPRLIDVSVPHEQTET